MKYRREKGSNWQNKLILVLSAIKKKKKRKWADFVSIATTKVKKWQ